MRTEISPCKCGGQAVLSDGGIVGNSFFIKCLKCHVASDCSYSEISAINDWNKYFSKDGET